MSLLLAPYNHAMRLGQGFNSYTQQICIDDAVVIDEQRPENVVTNDGTTMRIMAQKNAIPSAWTRQKEVIVGQPATAILVENAKKAKAEVKLIEAELADESAEESPVAEPLAEDEKSKPASVKVDSAKSEEPKTIDSKEKKLDTGKPKKKEAKEEVLSGESGSIDEVAEAREAPETDAPVAEEGKAKTPQASSSKPTAKKDVNKALPAKESKAPVVVAEASRGRSSSTVPASKTTEDKSAKKIPPGLPTDAKQNDDGIDRDTIAANMERNASKDDQAEVDRDAIAANLRANAEKPALPKPKQRGTSAGRARQISAAYFGGPPDRAAIRAALAGKSASDPATLAKEEAERARQHADEAELLAENRRYQKDLQQQQRKEEADRRVEEREEQRAIRAEKRAWDAQRRDEARKAIQEAANLKATKLEDLEKIRAQNQFVERFSGMSEQTQRPDFDPTAPRGPSQTVTYTTRFVDRLSDVTEDMSVSASLSIKAGKVGGSGKGSFVDSDKFKESDLNFYISVKVVNQTINFKDPLVYNPMRSVNKDNFREIYGDSFISGFVEGGEFNALVSMKILNKAKKSDIQAEAKVALTVGPVDVAGEANLGIARSNIETNTETTIQVSWSGGGHIKPMEQQWDIQSLMAAAARFPDLVADCPQRTYAILTKYDALRSFVAAKPASYTALQYENAQIYTSTLLDSFVSYKSLYKRLGENISGLQSKLLEIVPWNDEEQKKVSSYSTAVTRMGDKDKTTGLYPFQETDSYFEASIKGLSDARTAVRRQMARIVNEVDLMERDPKLATDEDHVEPYQSPVAFETRIPKIEVPERLRIRGNPLSGKIIATKTLSEKEQKEQLAKEEELAKSGPLYTSGIDPAEEKAFQDLLIADPVLSASFRASGAAGDSFAGQRFNNLDFLKSDWQIRGIRTEMASGALAYLAVSYENGLLVEKGVSQDKTRVKRFGDFGRGERITSASVEYGKQQGKDSDGKDMSKQILGLRLFTNRGRHLIARALHSEIDPKGAVVRDGVTYEDVKIQYIDLPFSSGTLKGFFGRSDDANGKIFRLGIIWCRVDETTPADAEVTFTDSGDVVDGEDLALLQRDQTAGSKSLAAMKEKLDAAEKRLAKEREDIEAKEKKIAELERSQQVLAPQHGSYFAEHKGWNPGQDSLTRCQIAFSPAYPTTPKVIFGLSRVDAEGSQPRALSLSSPETTPTGFNVQAGSFSGCRGYSLGCNWMTLPNDLHLETSMVYTGHQDRGSFEELIFFPQSFASPPKIAVWFQEFLWLNSGFMSLKCYPTEITAHYFKLRIESWAGRNFRQARVQYLAYPSEEDGKRVRIGRTSIQRAQPARKDRAPFYTQPFKNKPATFIAISEMDFTSLRNLRFECAANAPNERELEWSCNTWADSDMDHAECQWIAIE